jgi:DNA-binding IclR family transcriptional regulator
MILSMATTVGALERGLRIIDLLIEVEADPVRRPNGLSIQNIASELGLHKSTASRLMSTLVAHDYATPNEGRRGFRLGPAVQVHSALTVDQRRLSELAHPILERLVAETDECAHAAVASGGAALVIDDVETGQSLRVVAGRGRRVPLHCTSAGKCLLAFDLAPWPDELPERTARTLTKPDILRAHLAQVVEQGYALDDEENQLGVRCISAPVFGAEAAPVGCVGIEGPSIRMTHDRIDPLASAVMKAAEELSARINTGDAITVAA